MFLVINRPWLLLRWFLLCGLFSATTAAHLPAVRRVPTRSQQDSKRVLASRLIRFADRHKERSLRDVLGESDAAAPEPTRRDEARRRARAEDVPEDPTAETVDAGDRLKVETMSDLFAWAINSTVSVASANYSRKLFTPADADDRPVQGGGETASLHVGKVEIPREERGARGDARGSGVRRQALPEGDMRKSRGTTRKTQGKNKMEGARDERGLKDFELPSSAAESEFDVIRRNVHVLDTEGVSTSQAVDALLTLEELCHSIDNGHDLQILGGITPLMKALSSGHEAVRSSAAWALATCCQNNPPVQNASVELDAVPVLSRLAAHDESTKVRAKALFALNALLELEEARVTFEELPDAIDVVRNALVDSSDFRATRRALNLTELLVQRNLDSWKTQLEAWDIPVLVERLMRSHSDIDVRLSAARTIAALDGRPVA